jgi:hypothetical protein
MVDRNTFELTESTAEAERLFIEDFDTWDMTGYLYSKYWRAGASAHIGTGGTPRFVPGPDTLYPAQHMRRPLQQMKLRSPIGWSPEAWHCQ